MREKPQLCAMKKPSPGRLHPRRTSAGHRVVAREASSRARRHGDAGTILILGGSGRAGVLLAEGLLRETSAGLIIAGRNLDKAEAVATRLREAFPGKSVAARAVDASDPRSLQEAFQNIRLVLVASTTTAHTLAVARAALEGGADYLDIQYGRKKLEILRSLEGEMLRRRRCFITEAGFHPGLSAALVRYAASSLDRIDKARLAGVVGFRAEGPMPGSMIELVDSFRDYDPRVYRDGRWQKDNASGWLKSTTVEFGHPFGTRRCSPMLFEELRDLPTLIPSLKELRFDIAGFSPVIDWAVFPVILASLAIFQERALGPMARLLYASLKAFPPKIHCTALKIEARGELGGVPITFEFSVSHSDEYLLTAVPVVAGLRQYLSGAIDKPGLWMLGQIVDPYPFVSDLGRLGLDLSLKLR